ncbi:MAG: glycosyltransferase family 2 protein [Candidatus Pacebacteria bacterium]|nr:glycosyltransferase family 2 protein [Candidatus Paceibacterota bacterium]
MLTGIVLTKDEEKNIGDCLKSLEFCDELLVIDDFSKDKTPELALKLGAEVYQRKLGDDFAAQRNFGLQKAKAGWILFVDADERVSSELKDEIRKKINLPGVRGFYFKRQDVFFDRKLKFGETAKTKLLRLARRDAGQWKRRVHEVWQVNGKTAEMTAPLVHYPHQTITQFLEGINHYSSLHAQVLYEERKKTSLSQIIFYPLAKFFQNYFFRLGFLDGMPGLILALMMSFHSFLSRGKLFMLLKKGPVEYQQ